MRVTCHKWLTTFTGEGKNQDKHEAAPLGKVKTDVYKGRRPLAISEEINVRRGVLVLSGNF